MTQHDARDAQQSLQCMLSPWRTGGSVGRTIYALIGKAGHELARDDDALLIGQMDTAQLAEAACVAHNEWLRRHRC